MKSFVLFYCTNNYENTKSLILEAYNRVWWDQIDFSKTAQWERPAHHIWTECFTSADGRPDYFWIHVQFPVFGFIVADIMFPECVCMCVWSIDIM